MRDGSDAGLLPRNREVTVLFTDIPGFTSLSETLDANQVSDLLNHHFSLIAECVDANDGTIDKYIGDSVMAFWGAPSRQNDHAVLALQTVRAIAEKIHADNAKRSAEGLPPIRVRIGLHSGPALAGNIGAPGRINYTLVGDTVNAANRLEQLGKEIDPDAEVIALASGDTVEDARQASGSDGAVDLGRMSVVGERTLRGRATPVTVYRVI